MSVLADLEKLHAAEDFFSYLKVGYDPALVQVARLHILRRMGKYLRARTSAKQARSAVFAASARDAFPSLPGLRRQPG